MKTETMSCQFTKSDINVYTSKDSAEGRILTLWSKNPIEVGEEISINNSLNTGFLQKVVTVLEILENRDCKGVFENPEHKIKTFYKVRVSN